MIDEQDEDEWPKSKDFFILRRSDEDTNLAVVMFEHLDDESDPPQKPFKLIGASPDYHLAEIFKEGEDIYDEDSLMVSTKLFDLIVAAGAEATGKKIQLVSKESGEKFDYVLMAPQIKVETIDSEEAKPGYLQWSAVAFDPNLVQGKHLFKTTGPLSLLIVDSALAESIRQKNFRGVQLSELKVTPASGGQPADIAELRKKLKGI